jgi:hypothetical protein
MLIILRPLLSPRAKTNSSGTSYENWQHSTVHFVMTKTRHARTAARLDIGNTIVLRSRILPPISFAASVEMLVTWLEIVLIDKRALAGVMTVLVVPIVLALEMVLTVNTR